MQRAFAEYDHVIQALVPNGPVLAENLVTQQITRRTVPWKGLTKLLGCPLSGGMSSHAEVENAAPVAARWADLSCRGGFCTSRTNENFYDTRRQRFPR